MQKPTKLNPIRRAPGRLKRPSGPFLTRPGIIAVAVTLVEREGQDALSLRRLAAEIGVTPMALYTHFRDKGELLEAIIDAVIGELDLDALDNSNWRLWLEGFAVTSRRKMLQHRGFVRLLAEHPAIGDNSLRIGEAAYRVLLRHGVPPFVAVQGFWTVLTFVIGFVALEEPRSKGNGEDENAEERARRRIHAYAGLDRHQYPLTVELAHHIAAMVEPEQFHAGLNNILDGISQRVPRRA